MSTTVLGSTGFIGRHLVAALHGRNLHPWCPGREAMEEIYLRPLGTVYYCIGLTADFLSRPFDTVEAHVSLLARILQRANFDRLVYLSSTRLYDPLGDILATETAALPCSPATPRHLYHLSKGLGENLCLTASGGRAKVARLSCVLGDNPDDDGFVPALVRDSCLTKEIVVQSSPNFSRDYVGINDVVGLLMAIGEHGQQDIYNVASGINVSNQELFEIIKQRTGCEIVPALTGSAPSPRIDTNRIRAEFGFRPASLEYLIDILLRNAVKQAGQSHP